MAKMNTTLTTDTTMNSITKELLAIIDDPAWRPPNPFPFVCHDCRRQFWGPLADVFLPDNRVLCPDCERQHAANRFVAHALARGFAGKTTSPD
jgi:hypothetical protein